MGGVQPLNTEEASSFIRSPAYLIGIEPQPEMEGENGPVLISKKALGTIQDHIQQFSLLFVLHLSRNLVLLHTPRLMGPSAHHAIRFISGRKALFFCR